MGIASRLPIIVGHCVTRPRNATVERIHIGFHLRGCWHTRLACILQPACQLHPALGGRCCIRDAEFPSRVRCNGRGRPSCRMFRGARLNVYFVPFIRQAAVVGTMIECQLFANNLDARAPYTHASKCARARDRKRIRLAARSTNNPLLDGDVLAGGECVLLGCQRLWQPCHAFKRVRVVALRLALQARQNDLVLCLGASRCICHIGTTGHLRAGDNESHLNGRRISRRRDIRRGRERTRDAARDGRCSRAKLNTGRCHRCQRINRHDSDHLTRRNCA